MNRSHFSLLACIVALTACAKSSDPVCQQLDVSIDENIKRIALTLAEGGFSDKGAVQQAARYTMVNNRLQVIGINLEIQAQHNCAIRKAAIDPFLYEADAEKCLTAMLRQQSGEAAAACNLKNWKGKPE